MKFSTVKVKLSEVYVKWSSAGSGISSIWMNVAAPINENMKQLSNFLRSVFVSGCHDTQHNDIQFNDIQHTNIQYNDIQHNNIQCNDTQHNNIQYNDSQHNNNQNATLSIMILSITAALLCCVSFMLSVTFAGCRK
jgi:hypothetical protein